MVNQFNILQTLSLLTHSTVPKQIKDWFIGDDGADEKKQTVSVWKDTGSSLEQLEQPDIYRISRLKSFCSFPTPISAISCWDRSHLLPAQVFMVSPEMPANLANIGFCKPNINWAVQIAHFSIFLAELKNWETNYACDSGTNESWLPGVESLPGSSLPTPLTPAPSVSPMTASPPTAFTSLTAPQTVTGQWQHIV